jgi:hypothetical protein
MGHVAEGVVVLGKLQTHGLGDARLKGYRVVANGGAPKQMQVGLEEA